MAASRGAHLASSTAVPMLQRMTLPDEVRDGVRDVFTSLFPSLRGHFDIRKKQKDIPEWDSFAHMQLIAALEERFRIQIEVEEMIEVDSIASSLALVGKKSRALQPGSFNTFSELIEHWARRSPDKVFIDDLAFDRKYTYAGFNAKVNQAVHFLRKKGVKSGMIVTLRIRNSGEFLVLYFAVIRAGAIVNPVPFSMSDAEFVRHLRFVKPKLVFAEAVSDEVRKQTHAVLIARQGKQPLSKLFERYPDTAPATKLDPKKAACLYYSSGTTSDPKGILYSHRNMIALITSICRDFGHTSDTKHLGFLPMGHTAITNYSFLPVAYAGGTLVLAENFISIRRAFWDIVRKHGITYVETVPSVLFSILNTKYPRFSKRGLALEYVGCGSAPLPLSIQKQFQKKFKIPVANLYGLSETGPSHFDDPRRKGWKPGSIGRPLSVNDCKILNGALRAAPTGRVGEIAIKGPNVFVGYHKNEAAYRKAVRKGFFLTGDLGFRDRKGLFYYVDRKKDLIIKGGSNIFPGEVDEVLFKHPAVLEAATIGVPDVFLGEEIVSFVALKRDATERELQEHAQKHLQVAKRPKRIVVLPALPKTASGKLLRRTLRSLYEEKYEK